MRILAIGDIVGRRGREYVMRNLNKIREKYDIDFVVANGENAAETNGINPEIADRLIERGVDIITMGNHTFSCKNGDIAMEDNPRLVRPLNYPPELAGRGRHGHRLDRGDQSGRKDKHGPGGLPVPRGERRAKKNRQRYYNR